MESLKLIGTVAASVTGIYVALVVFTRIYGLRSYAKMSGFDFAMTVAIGSVVASAGVASEPPIVPALTTLVCVFILQAVAAKLRLYEVGDVLNNQPLLLMRGSEFLDDNMKSAGVTRADIWAKLREANVHSTKRIHAVVFETTGDVSVIHAVAPDEEVSPGLLEGVRGASA